MNNLEQLARRLYEAQKESDVDLSTSIKLWLNFFSLSELESLWSQCQNDLDLPFDDEVYNALDTIGYFQTVK